MLALQRPVFDLWVIELGSGLASRLTDGLAGPSSAVWSRDGRFVVYDEYVEHQILRKKASGAGEVERIYKGAVSLTPTDWTPDERYLVCQTDTVGMASDIYLIPMNAGAAAEPVGFLTSKFNEWGGQVSPDGRWMAYTSDESGESEVYVTSFPDKNTRLRISANGGEQPRWSGNGAELYYLGLEGRVLAVPFRHSREFDSSSPALITTFPTFASSVQAYRYDVTANGTRFVIVSQYGANSTEPLTVAVNWMRRR